MVKQKMTKCDICKIDDAEFLMEFEYIETCANYCTISLCIIDDYKTSEDSFKTCEKCKDVLSNFYKISDTIKYLKITKMENEKNVD